MGNLQFTSKAHNDSAKAILETPVKESDFKGKNLDQDLINLIISLLEKNPEKRITISAAIENNWLKEQDGESGNKNSAEVVTNARKLNSGFGMVDLLAVFIAKRSYMNDEMKNLRQLFKKVDKNHDGVVTKDEMLYAVENIGLMLTEDEINMIFLKYDNNKRGQLEFTEFLAAFIQRNTLTEKEKLEEFFEYLDDDKTGFVELDELKRTTGISFESAEKKALFQNFAGKDRKLNKPEFVEFITTLIEKELTKQSANNQSRKPIRKAVTSKKLK